MGVFPLLKRSLYVLFVLMENYGNLWVIFNPALLAQAENLEVPRRRNAPFLPHRDCMGYNPKEPCNSNSPTKSLDYFSISHGRILSPSVTDRNGEKTLWAMIDNVVVMIPTGRTPEDIGERLRITRDVMGYTQSEVARKCGIKPNQVNMFEAGGRRPSQETADAICDGLGLTLDWIFRGSLDGLDSNLRSQILSFKKSA